MVSSNRRKQGPGTRPASAERHATATDAREVVNNLRRLFKAIQEYSKAILRQTGLSAPQVWVLNVLDGTPRLSLNELSERLFAHPSTVSGIIDRLEERGVVRRERDPDDGRGVLLDLTPRGRRMVASSPPPVQVGLRSALERMPALQLRQLRRSLDHLVRETAARGLEAPFFETDTAARASRRRPRRT